MIEKKPRVEAHDILNVEDLKSLSTASAQLFAAIWRRMEHKGLLKIHVTDCDISLRAHVSLPLVDRARDELVQAGLMTVQRTSDGAFYKLIDV